MQSTTDRRMAILEYLCECRKTTCDDLVERFKVTRRTILRDLVVLTCSYPIGASAGRYDGGVYIIGDFHLGKQYLNEKQEKLLRELAASALDEESRATLQSILDKFAHKGVKR